MPIAVRNSLSIREICQSLITSYSEYIYIEYPLVFAINAGPLVPKSCFVILRVLIHDNIAIHQGKYSVHDVTLFHGAQLRIPNSSMAIGASSGIMLLYFMQPFFMKNIYRTSCSYSSDVIPV